MALHRLERRDSCKELPKRSEISMGNNTKKEVDQVAVFYTGDLVTSLQKTSLVPGANECVIYTTIGGAIGILVPFISKDNLGIMPFDVVSNE
ncbi:hypothetical protein TELCIR_17306 [Teladorsagia circumcincta]|uniref:RSE1/DDB1/CPSF1 C-terminal domain-containing protein n=1 Tax=Teladorsagia circumcincta TaxID=45464 RepID=A0A2G9TT44_TELCI|nr:hypothetical protein TELCIR_17306 [Teladorsagia circumcincta]